MSDSLKKNEKRKSDKVDDNEDYTISSLRQDIERLQRDISKLYTEELFMARIKISELEQKVNCLEAENASLLKLLTGQDKIAVCSDEDDDDWYTSHGQGD